MGNATRHLPGITSMDVAEIATLKIGEVEVTSTPEELNLNDNQVASVTWVIGSEATNVVNVAAQLLDASGTAMATRSTLAWYLSDNANGSSLASAPTGGIAIASDGLLIETLDNQAGLVTSEADGDIAVNITDSATRDLYMVLVLPNGSLDVSEVIAFAT